MITENKRSGAWPQSHTTTQSLHPSLWLLTLQVTRSCCWIQPPVPLSSWRCSSKTTNLTEYWVITSWSVDAKKARVRVTKTSSCTSSPRLPRLIRMAIRTGRSSTTKSAWVPKILSYSVLPTEHTHALSRRFSARQSSSTNWGKKTNVWGNQVLNAALCSECRFQLPCLQSKLPFISVKEGPEPILVCYEFMPS